MITLAFDVETFSDSGIKKDAVNRLKAKVFSFSTCDMQGKCEVYRLDNDEAEKAHKRLEELFLSGEYHLVAHNAKFDLGMMEQYFKDCSIPFNFKFDDTLLAFKIFYSNHYSHALDDLTYDLCRYPKVQDEQIKEWMKGKRGVTYRDVPEVLMKNYQKHDVIRTILLWKFAQKRFSENPQYLETYNWEKELIFPTIEMENYGSKICPKKTEELIMSLSIKMDNVLEDINKIAGENIKPGTGKWRELMSKVGVTNDELTDTGNMVLDKHLMLKLRDVLKNEEYKKFIANPDNIGDIAKLADCNLKYKAYQLARARLNNYLKIKDSDNVLHPTINTCQADTGRESCTNPNLQNVDKSNVMLNPYATPMRSIFIVRDNKFNVHIDFSGQEKRLLVHYSGEDELVKIINDKGDMHAPSVEEFYGAGWENGLVINGVQRTKKEMRDASKNGGFCIDYGGEVETLANTLGIPIEAATEALARYRKRFPKLSLLMPKMCNHVKRFGYVQTTFKRTLLIPRNQKHKGINYLIQGTAAEMIKRAQVKLYKFLQQRKSPIKMILPIHDEIVFDCPNDYKDRVQDFKDICNLMVDYGDTFSVPFEVEMSITRDSWENKKKISNMEEI